MQKRVNRLLPIFISVLFSLWMLQGGCGTAGNPASQNSNTSGGIAASSGVTITGTVQAPVSTTTSVSIGQSVDTQNVSASKAVSKGSANGRVIVSKTVSDLPVSSGTVTAKTPSGTTLGTGTISSAGAITNLVINPSSLDSTNQIVLNCNVSGKEFSTIVDSTGKTAGTTVSAGTVNTDSTLAANQVFYQADPTCTPGNITVACAAKFISGETNMLALYNTFTNGLNVSSTVGTDTAASAFQAIRTAYRAACAGDSSQCKFDKLNEVLAGGNTINTWKSYDSSTSGLDMSAVIQQIQSYMPAVAKTFQDATTYAKYHQAGDSGWSAAAQYFGKMTKEDLANVSSRPEGSQGYLNQNADDFNGGNIQGFDTMKKSGAARAMGQMMGKCTASDLSGKYDVLKKLMDAGSSSLDSSLASGQIASVGEAYCNRLKSATDTTTLNNIKSNASAFTGPMFRNPSAYTGSGGSAAWQNMDTLSFQSSTMFRSADFRPCASDAECASVGKVCGSMNACVSSTTCTSNCEPGEKCASSTACYSGYCSGGYCGFPNGVSPRMAALKQSGVSCSANSECASFNCVEGICTYYGMLGSGGTCNYANHGSECASGVCGRHGQCLSATPVALSGVVTNFVGPPQGTTTAAETDGVGSDVRFNGSTGFCLTPDGSTAFVGDTGTGGHTIRKIIMATGAVTTFAGSAGSTGTTNGVGTAARFNRPSGCVIDPLGASLYVADRGSHTVRKIVIATASVSTFAGTATQAGSTDGTGTDAKFNSPRDIVMDSQGANLYVVTVVDHLIRKVTVSGAVVTTATGTAGVSGSSDGIGTNASFNGSTGLTIDPTDMYLYVADAGNRVLRRITIATQQVVTIAGQVGVNVDLDGIGTGATFKTPANLVMDPTGHYLYMTESSGNKIRKIAIATSQVTTLTGSGTAGDTNGIGTTALFSNPGFIVFNPTGTILYVVEFTNNKIRQIQ